MGVKELVTAISDKGLQLVVLSACRSADITGDNVLDGASPGLFLAYVPAVVGMQFSISTGDASTFIGPFYEKLCETGSIFERQLMSGGAP